MVAKLTFIIGSLVWCNGNDVSRSCNIVHGEDEPCIGVSRSSGSSMLQKQYKNAIMEVIVDEVARTFQVPAEQVEEGTMTPLVPWGAEVEIGIAEGSQRECVKGHEHWVTITNIPGEIVKAEGSGIGSLEYESVEDCYSACEGNEQCHNVMVCPLDKKCYLKEGAVEPGQEHRYVGKECQTHYKCKVQPPINNSSQLPVRDGSDGGPLCFPNMINPLSCECGTTITQDANGCNSTKCTSPCQVQTPINNSSQLPVRNGPDGGPLCLPNMINPSSCECGITTKQDGNGCNSTKCTSPCQASRANRTAADYDNLSVAEETPSLPLANLGRQCAEWCYDDEADWEEKCFWEEEPCAGCDECHAMPLPPADIKEQCFDECLTLVMEIASKCALGMCADCEDCLEYFQHDLDHV